MNKATLKPFQKNDPRINREGRPKESKGLKTLLVEALKKIGEGQTEPYEILLVKKMLLMAIKEGNEQIIRLIWNYLEGLPKGSMDLGMDDDAKEFLGYICLPALRKDDDKK